MKLLSKRRLGRRRNLPQPEFNLTSLIDTAFTLLVIFMVTAPMLKENALQIELPKGSVQETKTKNQELVVYVDKIGSLFLDGTAVNRDRLVEQLKQKVQRQSKSGQPCVLFVKADKVAHYGTVIELVDRLKKIEGLTYVALATAQPT